MSVQVVTAKMAEVELKEAARERPNDVAPAAAPAMPTTIALPKEPDNNTALSPLSQPLKGIPASAMKRTDPVLRPGDGLDSPEGAVSEAPRTVKKVMFCGSS